MKTHSKNNAYIHTFDRVVITGASSGIGSSIIELLGKINPNLSICNLSRSRPERFKNVSNFSHISCDLSSPDASELALQKTLKWLKEKNQNKRILLINNSGFGTYGIFPSPNIERNLDMLNVNMRAPVWLTGNLAGELESCGGAVINIASTAAFQPAPYLSTYGASKAFLQHWSLGLAEEWKTKKIHVLAVCPGPTETAFFQEAGFKEAPLKKNSGMTSDEVARITIKALCRGKILVTCGWMNRFVAAFTSKLPKVWATKATAIVMRKLRLERYQ